MMDLIFQHISENIYNVFHTFFFEMKRCQRLFCREFNIIIRTKNVGMVYIFRHKKNLLIFSLEIVCNDLIRNTND